MSFQPDELFIDEIESQEAAIDEERTLPPMCEQCGDPYSDGLPCICEIPNNKEDYAQDNAS